MNTRTPDADFPFEEDGDSLEYGCYNLPKDFYMTEIEYDNRLSSCSFTGHRILSPKEKNMLVPVLKKEIIYLISNGITEFHCGGALGFDTLAATVVFDLSRQFDNIKLVLELPYESQAEKWNSEDKRKYEFLKSKASEINFHAKNPTSKQQAVDALLKRNRIMIDKSQYCICYYKNKRSGTAYTVNYAKLHDRQITNLAVSD